MVFLHAESAAFSIDTPIGNRWRFVEREPYGIKDERVRRLVLQAMNSGDSGLAGVLRTPPQALRELWRLVESLKPDLPRIKQRALLVQAREDDVASMSNVQYLQRRLGGLAETVILDDSYHLVTMDRQRSIVTERVVSLCGRSPQPRSLVRSTDRRCRSMPHDRIAFQTRIVAGVAEVPEAEWNRSYPGEPEGWRYYRACEAGTVPGVQVAAVEVHDRSGFVAAAPLFQLSYRLDTPFQGAIRHVAAAVHARLPSMTEWRMLGVGSPYTDRCHIALRPGLSDAERGAALAALNAAVEGEAVRRRAVLIVYKDLAGAELAIMQDMLLSENYAHIRSLPVACLDLPAPDFEAYLAHLSGSMRKDVKRKMRAAGAVRIEVRTNTEDVADEIDRLYEQTRQYSKVHYGALEELSQQLLP